MLLNKSGLYLNALKYIFSSILQEKMLTYYYAQEKNIKNVIRTSKKKTSFLLLNISYQLLFLSNFCVSPNSNIQYLCLLKYAHLYIIRTKKFDVQKKDLHI